MPALVLVLVAALGGIGMTRAKLQGESGTLADILASLLSWMAVASLGVILVLRGFQPLARALDHTPVALGSVSGLSLLVVVMGGRRIAGILFAWGTRRPVDFDSVPFAVRTALFMALGFVGVGAAAAWAAAVLPGAMQILLLPALVTAVPVFQAVILPWATLLRAPTLHAFPEVPEAREVEGWFQGLCRNRGLHHVRLRVQPGRMRNAYVVGGLFGHWVVVGEVLLREMDPREVKAILAHEVAHVVRRDVLLYLGTAAVAGTCYAVGLPHVFRMWQSGALIPGALLAGGLGALCFGAIPGWVSRRAEFGADALATALLGGDGRSLAAGLTSLALLKGYGVDRESLTHPSVKHRIRALGLDAA